MRKRYSPFALALIGALLLVPELAAERRSHYHYQFVGPEAAAQFTSIDANGVLTNVFVQTASQKQLFKPGPPMDAPIQLNLFISRYAADGTLLMDAMASVNPPSPPGEYSVDNSGLQWARLKVTVVVDDSISGGSFPVNVTLNWIGTGLIANSHRNNHVHTPDGIFHEVFHGKYRPAETTGIVSDGTTNFTPEVSTWAQIGNSSGGVISME